MALLIDSLLASILRVSRFYLRSVIIRINESDTLNSSLFLIFQQSQNLQVRGLKMGYG